jgi:wobble nucleotide-excising tRNase
MFKKIIKIKDFGIYRDFKWGTDIPELKKFNVIYARERLGQNLINTNLQIV